MCLMHFSFLHCFASSRLISSFTGRVPFISIFYEFRPYTLIISLSFDSLLSIFSDPVFVSLSKVGYHYLSQILDLEHLTYTQKSIRSSFQRKACSLPFLISCFFLDHSGNKYVSRQTIRPSTNNNQTLFGRIDHRTLDMFENKVSWNPKTISCSSAIDRACLFPLELNPNLANSNF
jgi:hypothetical protein